MESSAFTLAEVEAAHAAQENRYVQFLTVPAMSLGLYNLPAGSEDLQTPHTVSYTHLRAHETVLDLVCRLLLEKKKPHIDIHHSDARLQSV